MLKGKRTYMQLHQLTSNFFYIKTGSNTNPNNFDGEGQQGWYSFLYIDIRTEAYAMNFIN